MKKKVGGAATFAQRRKQPLPDLKTCVRQALDFSANQLEAHNIVDVFGWVDGENEATYTEALKVAVNYVRMGAQL